MGFVNYKITKKDGRIRNSHPMDDATGVIWLQSQYDKGNIIVGDDTVEPEDVTAQVEQAESEKAEKKAKKDAARIGLRTEVEDATTIKKLREALVKVLDIMEIE